MNNTKSFSNTVSSEEELRSILGFPSELVANKTIDHLDAHCRHFLAQSPLLLMSTADDAGHCHVSPREVTAVLQESYTKRLFLELGLWELSEKQKSHQPRYKNGIDVGGLFLFGPFSRIHFRC